MARGRSASAAAAGTAAEGGAAGDERLRALREACAACGVQALVVPSEDAHYSEMPPECFQRRRFVSRFTGSAGLALVLQDEAMLWTDGRYFLQAENELGPEWKLMKQGLPGTPEWIEVILTQLKPGDRVCINPSVHSARDARSLRDKLAKGGIELSLLDGEANPVDAVWEREGRPPLPSDPVRLHPIDYAGVSVEEKLSRMREEMAKNGAGVLVSSMLDEVAWLFNIRGSDVPASPVVVSYAVVAEESAALYCGKAKVPPAVLEALSAAGVEVKEYDELAADVTEFARLGKTVWIDPDKANFLIAQAAEAGAKLRAEEAESQERAGKAKRAGASASAPEAMTAAAAASALVESASPVIQAKALKNEAELAGMREAHLRDAVVMARFWSWLEAQVEEGGARPTEAAAAEKLHALRQAQPGFLDVSFETILGEGPNGAIIHHRAGDARTIGPDSMVLLDAGAQFDCGTTDATRTVHFGEPTAHQKECFTRVLKGHVALSQAVFPEGAPGLVIDSFARQSLWRAGLDYRHGTGHGVGAALNVHEGPQSISMRFNNISPLLPGMIVSNEPGYYEPGAFGIRIENLLVVREEKTAHNFGGTTFLGFDRLTHIPIQRKLLDHELLTDAETSWLNEYHEMVWRAVSPRLEADEQALEWLKHNTREIVPVPANAVA